jgi:hypothetical protein
VSPAVKDTGRQRRDRQCQLQHDGCTGVIEEFHHPGQGLAASGSRRSSVLDAKQVVGVCHHCHDIETASRSLAAATPGNASPSHTQDACRDDHLTPAPRRRIWSPGTIRADHPPADQARGHRRRSARQRGAGHPSPRCHPSTGEHCGLGSVRVWRFHDFPLVGESACRTSQVVRYHETTSASWLARAGPACWSPGRSVAACLRAGYEYGFWVLSYA